MFPKPIMDERDYEDSLAFFEKMLRAGSPCRLDAEYPLAFRPENADHILVLRSNGEIQAGLACLERQIEIQPGVSRKAVFIGSVVTAPQHRNRGLQRQLFHAAEESAEKWDADFLVLWSNQLEFYEKLGFSLGGLQASWFATHQSPLNKKQISVQVENSSKAKLSRQHFDEFDKKTCRVRRSFEETQRLWKIPEMLVAYTDNAYALMGKGEDFHHVCHEWAGPAEEVLACFDALRSREPKLRILSPGVLHLLEETEVTTALENASYENRLEYLGLFKPISSRVQAEGFQPDQLGYPFFIWGLDSI